MKLVFAQATWREDWEDTKACIDRVKKYVDDVIIVHDQTMTMEQMEEMNRLPINSIFNEFKDNLPEMRNAYLRVAKLLKADYVCVSDPDELYTVELCENLKSLIEAGDAQGYNMFPVHCVDQFDNVEWLDDLDKLKESPGGYRQTDFWKPLLVFKLYPDVHYEGVGTMKNVHEMLVASTPWNAKQLPREFSYIHKKSALKIWRNAARNMFIGGGGDNVGDQNPFWTELRQLCSSRGIASWPQFESKVKEGFTMGVGSDLADNALHAWLIKALNAPPTNWGTETRETAKWYFALHKDEVTPIIDELLRTPPKMTDTMKVEAFVAKTYFDLLGRPPDEQGRKSYTEQIVAGMLKPEDFIEILKNSGEYKQKHTVPSTAPIEKVRMQIPVNVDVDVSEELFTEALRRSHVLFDIIKPKMDIGDYVIKSLKPVKQRAFLNFLYGPDATSPRDVYKWLLENLAMKDSLAVCIMGYHDALPLIYKTIDTVMPHLRVGDEVWVQGDDFTEQDKEDLFNQSDGGVPVMTKIVPWKDEFSDYKNEAIASANTDWVLILDHDEVPTSEMAQSLRTIIALSEGGSKFNLVSFNAIDVQTVNGQEVNRTKPNPGGKPLLHVNVPAPYYGNPHIWLKPAYYNWQLIHHDTAYEHIKDRDGILPNSVRNVFLGGGGDSVKEGNPAWVELREVTAELGLNMWKDFNRYLKAGKINPKLLSALKKLAEMPWKDEELKDPLRYYYLLHPEEEE